MELYQLDCAVLKSDPKIIKIIKRKILKPIGYHFRKKHFNKYYKLKQKQWKQKKKEDI